MMNRNFTFLETIGYEDKSEAYDNIRLNYSHLNGVTVYYKKGLWFIVQSRVLADQK